MIQAGQPIINDYHIPPIIRPLGTSKFLFIETNSLSSKYSIKNVFGKSDLRTSALKDDYIAELRNLIDNRFIIKLASESKDFCIEQCIIVELT